MQWDHDLILGQLSQKFDVKELLFHKFDDNFFDDWHNPPLGAVYIIFISGKQEIDTSNGSKRIFGVGDILLCEDINGVGHKTKAIKAGVSAVIKI